MVKPSGFKAAPNPKGKGSRPGNKTRVPLKSNEGKKKPWKPQGKNEKALFTPDVVFDRWIIFDLSKPPGGKSYNPILEVMWTDLAPVVPIVYKTGHISKEMRRTKFRVKLGGPKQTPFHTICKVDRAMNARSVNTLKEKLRILCCKIFDDDKRRNREQIFRIMLRSVHPKQVAGTGKTYLYLPRKEILTFTYPET